MARTASLRRETGETKIGLTLDIDGTGVSQIHTGQPARPSETCSRAPTSAAASVPAGSLAASPLVIG